MNRVTRFCQLQLLHSQHRNAPTPSGIGARPDHDLDVLIERSQKFHPAFNGELVKAVIFESRDLGLRNAEQGGDFALFELTCLEQFIYGTQCSGFSRGRLGGTWDM